MYYTGCSVPTVQYSKSYTYTFLMLAKISGWAYMTLAVHRPQAEEHYSIRRKGVDSQFHHYRKRNFVWRVVASEIRDLVQWKSTKTSEEHLAPPPPFRVYTHSIQETSTKQTPSSPVYCFWPLPAQSFLVSSPVGTHVLIYVRSKTI
jgi:hypothetical protein